MATYREWLAAEFTDAAGVIRRVGSRSAPVETTIVGTVLPGNVTLATATALTVWTSAEPVTSFEKFWLKADQALKIELTVDAGGEVGSEEIVFVHPANEWFRLASEDALANYSGTLSGGSADVVDEIVVRNESGSTANIEYWVIK